MSCLVKVRWLLESAERRISHRGAEANHQQGGGKQKRLSGRSPGRAWGGVKAGAPGVATPGLSNTCCGKGRPNKEWQRAWCEKTKTKQFLQLLQKCPLAPAGKIIEVGWVYGRSGN